MRRWRSQLLYEGRIPIHGHDAKRERKVTKRDIRNMLNHADEDVGSRGAPGNWEKYDDAREVEAPVPVRQSNRKRKREGGPSKEKVGKGSHPEDKKPKVAAGKKAKPKAKPKAAAEKKASKASEE